MLRGFIPSFRRNQHLENVVSLIGKRGIAASTSKWAKKMPDRPPLVDESEFTEAFLKGSGPGGQKIVSNAVLYWHFPSIRPAQAGK
jgi:hypothetical protein